MLRRDALAFVRDDEVDHLPRPGHRNADARPPCGPCEARWRGGCRYLQELASIAGDRRQVRRGFNPDFRAALANGGDDAELRLLHQLRSRKASVGR